MPKVAPVSKPRWSEKSTQNPRKKKKKSPDVSFADVLHTCMLTLKTN